VEQHDKAMKEALQEKDKKYEEMLIE